MNNSQSVYFRALLFATEKHGTQPYDANKPYVFHLANVCQTLNRFGFSVESHPHLQVSGILHDVVEDTGVKNKEIRALFGDKVADIVKLVTDKEGETREERHRATYPILATNNDAILVKLADRISNVEYSEFSGNLKQWRKYRKEYAYFKETLYKVDQVEAAPMWATLDKLFDWE
ncbi:MAG: HD domain-containing protein [Ignavibacteria bacterium]|jgi:(p)ppGpp synthase/HD superfamily hydrolase